MIIKERKPLPLRCRFCREIRKAKGNTGAACSECEYALDRFELLDDDGNIINVCCNANGIIYCKSIKI